MALGRSLCCRQEPAIASPGLAQPLVSSWSWSRDSSRSLEDTAHLKDVELTTHWNLRDRHIQSLMLALHADLEDGSPAGPLYGESLGLALGIYLVRRYSVRNCAKPDYRGSMPLTRLNRILQYINQNLAQDLRLWELAQNSWDES
jgi:AraC family transcriptional regulator